MRAGHVPSPWPRDVQGYAEAVTAGRTPARPSRPPSLLPGKTAHRALVECGFVLCGAAVLVAIAVSLGPESGGQLSVGQLATVLGATLVGVVALAKALGRFRRRLLTELAAGYVTTTFTQGTFWFADRPGPRVGNDVVGWLWDGVWVLDPSGRVVSAPRPEVGPPGFWPSPNRPGRLGLWTGAQWIGVRPDD